jgi:hypothetical protein
LWLIGLGGVGLGVLVAMPALRPRRAELPPIVAETPVVSAVPAEMSPPPPPPGLQRDGAAQVPEGRGETPPAIARAAQETSPSAQPRPVEPVTASGKTTLERAILAQFHFDGNAADASGRDHWFSLKNTVFKDNALYLNGKYEHGSGTDGYRAQCELPELNYDGFTVALRFKSESFAGTKNTLLVGGTSYRWFSLSRSPEGSLQIGLNNQDLMRAIPDTRIDEDRWYVVMCGVDLKEGRIVAYLDSKKVGEIRLPKGFKLRVATSPAAESDKLWLFTNYSNARVFHGLIDEFIVFDRMLTSDEFAEAAGLVRSGFSSGAPG